MSEAMTSDAVQLRVRGRLSRREAMQWVMAAVATSALPAGALAQRHHRAVATGPAKPYGTDPNLLNVYQPGDLWPLTFTAAQRATVAALADVILPDDQYGPAASKVGVPEMIDEWISAPYPEQQSHRPVILDGIAWLDAESAKRFKKSFAPLSDQQKHSICDDICFPPAAKPDFHKPAQFFNLFRTISASAYYATPQGWQAIGYVGNVPLATFDGPPPQVLAKLGVEQTVK